MPLKFNIFYLKNMIYQEVLHGRTLLLIFEHLLTGDWQIDLIPKGGRIIEFPKKSLLKYD